jgi:hypothetical protein
MPKPSWEPSNNAAFYGFLKFLDFQTSYGKDLHVTFEKAQKAHVSIYELGGKKQLGGSIWMYKEAAGLRLSMMEWWAVAMSLCGSNGTPEVQGYKNYEDFFNKEVNDKAFELGIIPQKPAQLAVNNNRKIIADEFPGLF